MPEIVISTEVMEDYGNRLRSVKNRVDRLNLRIHGLYSSVGLVGLRNIINSNVLANYSTLLHSCIDYAQNTARDFNSVEGTLLISFHTVSGDILDTMLASSVNECIGLPPGGAVEYKSVNADSSGQMDSSIDPDSQFLGLLKAILTYHSKANLK